MPKLTWPLALYEVTGESMAPTYHPGARLLGLNWFRRHHLRTGQIIVANQSGRLVVKRIASISLTNVHLAGDNRSASTDSRTLGPVSLAAIKAVIIAKVLQ